MTAQGRALCVETVLALLVAGAGRWVLTRTGAVVKFTGIRDLATVEGVTCFVEGDIYNLADIAPGGTGATPASPRTMGK